MGVGWSEDRACKDKPTSWFFPTRANDPSIERAKKICRKCPVKDACLEYGMQPLPSGESVSGIFGGTTESERRLIQAIIGKRTFVEIRISLSSTSVEPCESLPEAPNEQNQSGE